MTTLFTKRKRKQTTNEMFIDCMVFNAVFNSISFISWRLVYLSTLSRSSFSPTYPRFPGVHLAAVLRTIFFPSHWLLSHITTVETTDSGETAMNPVTMTIITPRKEYWPSLGIEPVTSYS